MSSIEKPSVIEVLYHAAHKPDLSKKVPFGEGFCGRCHQRKRVAEASKVLSSRFGSWDWITPDTESKRRFLCHPCAWSYRETRLRRYATLIRREGGAVHHPTGPELRQVLSGPLPPTVAILLPVAGKKAVAPMGAWGLIAADHGRMEWTRGLAKSLGRLMILKRLGASETALASPEIPGQLIDSLPPEEWLRAHEAWRALAPLRSDKTVLPALLRLTRETV